LTPAKETVEQSKAWGLVEMDRRETPVPSAEKQVAVKFAVERELAVHELPGLRGVIDLIRPRGTIADFKTAATPSNERQAEHRNQLHLTTCGLFYREATGENESQTSSGHGS